MNDARPMTIAQAYALAFAEAVKRTNENRTRSAAVLSPTPLKPKGKQTNE